MTILPDCPARIAGLREGDIIISLGGNTVSGVDDIHRRLDGDTIGKKMAVGYLRDWVRLDTTAVIPVENPEG